MKNNKKTADTKRRPLVTCAIVLICIVACALIIALLNNQNGNFSLVDGELHISLKDDTSTQTQWVLVSHENNPECAEVDFGHDEPSSMIDGDYTWSDTSIEHEFIFSGKKAGTCSWDFLRTDFSGNPENGTRAFTLTVTVDNNKKITSYSTK